MTVTKMDAPALAAALEKQTGTTWGAWEAGKGGAVVSSCLSGDSVPTGIWLPPPPGGSGTSNGPAPLDAYFGDRTRYIRADSVDEAVRKMVDFWREEEDDYFRYATKTRAAMDAIRRAIAGPTP